MLTVAWGDLRLHIPSRGAMKSEDRTSPLTRGGRRGMPLEGAGASADGGGRLPGHRRISRQEGARFDLLEVRSQACHTRRLGHDRIWLARVDGHAARETRRAVGRI